MLKVVIQFLSNFAMLVIHDLNISEMFVQRISNKNKLCT